MTTVVTEIVLISVTEQQDLASCPWREFLDVKGLPYKDLNYVNCDEAQLRNALYPIETWLDNEAIKRSDLPVIVYQYAETMNPVRSVILRTVVEAKKDNRLKGMA